MSFLIFCSWVESDRLEFGCSTKKGTSIYPVCTIFYHFFLLGFVCPMVVLHLTCVEEGIVPPSSLFSLQKNTHFNLSQSLLLPAMPY